MATHSSSLSTSSAPHPNDPIEYNVLYYKRTNKVHKSKGVSRCDGRLTVAPPPKSTVVLRDATSKENDPNSSDSEEDDTPRLSWKKRRTKSKGFAKSNGGIIYSGVQNELATRSLEVDETIVLGGYEVEILNRIEKVSDSTTTEKTIVESKPSLLMQKKPLRNQPLIVRRRPLHAKPTGTKAQTHTPSTSTVVNRRPLHPKPTARKNPPSASHAVVPTQSPDTTPVSLTRKPTTGLLPSQPSKLLPKKRPAQKLDGTCQPATKVKTSNALCPLANITMPPSVKAVLRPHQVTGVAFLFNTLTTLKGAILADEMGLGKTLMTIAVISALHRQQRHKSFVVACPSSLCSNWANEFDKWLGRASQPKRTVVQKGDELGVQQIRSFSQQLKQRRNAGSVLILSYDLFRIHKDHFNDPQQDSLALLVVDEGHRLKNKNGSLTLSALESLSSEARLLLTATPIQNNLGEFYGLAHFCCPGILGDWNDFQRDYARPIAAANNKTASISQRTLGKKQSQALDTISKTFILRRLQKDILKSTLPPRTEALLFCQPTAEQARLYQQVASNYRYQDSHANNDALTSLTTLRKICLHPQLVDGSLHDDDDDEPSGRLDSVSNKSPPVVGQSGKLLVLQALLESIREKEPEGKVVVVSNFTSALSLIEDLVMKPQGWSYLRLDGSTPAKDRQELVKTFDHTSPDRSFCLLLSSKAGGCGLNLVRANRLILYDPDFNPSVCIQAMGRVYRTGQTRPCTIYRLFTAGTVEEVIYQRQLQKNGLASSTMKGSATAGRFSHEELADCFALKKDAKCDTLNKMGKWTQDYYGSESLEDCGCSDAPLLHVADLLLSSTLGYVHIVKENEGRSSLDIGAERASEDSDENDCALGARRPVPANASLDDSSSDEEFEF